jgi:hypothetical protein
MSGSRLTDAARETAPGGLFVRGKPLRRGPNVNLRGHCGSLLGGGISTSLLHVP